MKAPTPEQLAEIAQMRAEGYEFVTYGEGGPRPMTDEQAAQAFLVPRTHAQLAERMAENLAASARAQAAHAIEAIKRCA